MPDAYHPISPANAVKPHRCPLKPKFLGRFGVEAGVLNKKLRQKTGDNARTRARAGDLPVVQLVLIRSATGQASIAWKAQDDKEDCRRAIGDGECCKY